MPKSPETLTRLALEFLGKSSYRPLKDHELAQALGLPASERGKLRAVLKHLEHEGRVKRLRKNRWALPQASRETTGRLSVNVQGLGFVTPDMPGAPDIVIEKSGIGNALHGDRVAVELSGRAAGRPGDDRPRGRVVRVIQRKMTQIAGILRQSKYYAYVIPSNPRVPNQIRVREIAPGLKPPDEYHQVIIRLDDDLPLQGWLTGVVTEDLGEPDQPGVDMLTILKARGLDPEFDAKVQAAARQQPSELSDRDMAGREDLRPWLTLTIDPEDAKDFDDAVSLRKIEDGRWELGVHIADVAHFVRMKSEMDREAQLRGNSVYMVDRFIPMLPPYLTGDVCSLRPNVDRLTHSVVLILDADGRVERYRTTRSVIHSRCRLNYEQVQAFMDGRPDPDIPEELHSTLTAMAHLAGRLRRNRMAAGALDLTMPEVKCELDAEGRVLDIRRRGAPEAYHLIEEFMLLANVAVAEIIGSRGVPALYRIHEEPSDDQWAAMAESLAALDIPASPQDRMDLQEITRSLAGTPREYAGNLAILRNLKRAVYSSERVGHFGLAFETYTHFTSPIRRYPDLVVHRILNAIEEHRSPPYTHEEVAALAAHCTETERNADEAEEESLVVKRIAFYADRLRRGDIGPHEGLITALSPRGIVVELADTLQRGMVSFASMTDNFYTFDRARGRAIGRRGHAVWKVGQPVSVEVTRVDVYRRLVDFRMARSQTGRSAAPRVESRRKGRRQRRR